MKIVLQLFLFTYNFYHLQAHVHKLVSAEHRLVHNLTQEYMRQVRPVDNVSYPVHLSFDMAFVRLDDLNEVSQTVRAHVWLKQMWTDISLQWNPKDYDGIQDIRLPASQIWTPDIVAWNNANPEFKYSLDYNVVVASNGHITYIPHMLLETHCDVDMTDFPYDTHKCIIKFGSWTYKRSQISVTLMRPKGNPLEDVAKSNSHREWDITGEPGRVNHVKYDCCPEQYTDVTYTLTFKRRSNYYTTLFVGPSVMLGLMVPAMFLLPPNSGNKPIMGMAIILGQILMLEQLNAYLKAAHPAIPRIGVYYIAVLSLAAIATFMAIIVYSVFRLGARKRPVPRTVRRLFINCLGRLVCVDENSYVIRQDPAAKQLEDIDNVSEDRKDIIVESGRNTIMQEWRQLALVLDRLLFVIFIILSLIIMIPFLNR